MLYRSFGQNHMVCFDMLEPRKSASPKNFDRESLSFLCLSEIFQRFHLSSESALESGVNFPEQNYVTGIHSYVS